MRKYFYIWLIVASILSTSCSKYQKTLKSGDINRKLEMAISYYNKKDYYRANTLFEQLQDNFNGTAMAEKILYYSAYCNYGLKNYALGGFQFKAYFENFPTGEWAEESLYMYAYCNFLESQPSYLDQTDTFKAIESINLFVSVYTDSKYIPECNSMIDNLRARLSAKAYRLAKLYYNMAEYKSAIVVLQNVVRDYPEIAQKEELEFLTVKSHYLLAINSIEEKREERLQNTLKAYTDFLYEYPNSKYGPELKSYKEKAIKELDRINNKKQLNNPKES
jgi:outer membrane protein assembly factor BamD